MSTEGEIIEAWPTCPECGANRHAECLVCGSVAEFFPAAYQADDRDESLRVCEACDDTAELRYFRRCPRCNYDFGDGYELPAPEPRGDYDRFPVSRLEWLLLGGMAAGMAALLGYFAWLFRK
ncbi:hypothetical protein NA78x_003311 [Anatilimnocola sp. NA78]|uniref:hypothetical protein n=1 Tax=Anatilimnocola sp. NA78 TaxID=3415683 RepID=UPI003CE54D63